ncbi:MAG: DUF4139 domain-containing protein, partial [Alphaproteobacteria bacterium]|nr:DUF4139 domain-containing protein [Alphaproteobacteria bacterium]
MKRLVLTLVVLVATTAAAAAQTLTLKRIVLSQGGVGYFEFETEVTGNAELALPVRLDQVDDVLKSIVVFDDRGNVGGVRLPGQEPLSQAFRDFTFPREALESPVALLNALQGAEVNVAGATPMSGRIVRVLDEQSQAGGDRTITRHRVTLMGATGLQSFVLEEATSVTFADSNLQAEVARALRAVAENRARDRRTLTIVARGEGRRAVRVGYVVEVPLWKTSYRLAIDPDPAVTRGRLQGWAVVENLSGQDWTNVELSLVSGNPVTFRQALYRPFFVSRPEVPIEVYGRVLPRVDTGTMTRDVIAGLAEDRAAPQQQLRAAGRALAAPAPQAMARGGAAEVAAAPPPVAAPGMAAATAAEAQEATTQISFRFPQPVSVPSGQTFVAPIIDREVPAQSIALYQPETNPRNPFAAVRLGNDGEAGLPPGVLTLYERSAGGLTYVGDARMGPVAGGQSRLLSFAVDTKTMIERRAEAAQSIATGTISGGLLRLTRIDRQTTTYRIAAPPREARQVAIEQARPTGWRLVSPATPAPEETATEWRFVRRVAAGETATLAVVLERPREETLRLLDLNPQQLAVFASANELSPAVRAAFTEIARLKRAVDDARRE